MPILARAVSESLTTSIPEIDADPDVGGVMQERMDMIVVLPAPFGPSSPKISPSATSKLTASTAISSP